MIGSRLGQYRVTGELGRGGMGEVWRAADARLGREVALKLLPEGFADDPERLARFEREARVLASLNHPNIATLYGLETAVLQTSLPNVDGEAEAIVAPVSRRQGPSADPSVEPVAPAAPDAAVQLAQPDTGAGRRCTFLVMELVEGEGLDELIGRGPIPSADVIPFAHQIAEALEAAHEAGIVHRDLKPANVRVRPDGAVKVLDFGLAKAWQAEGGDGTELSLSPTMTRHGTAAGVILGTASYMSPEQARGKPVDRRADIWAFGVVLWEMLTGCQLFHGDTVSDVLAAVLREAPDLDALPADTPRRLRTLVERCLERDPRRRLRDIGEARVALDDLASGVGVDAAEKHSGATATDGPPRLRRLVPWAIALVAAVAIAAIARLTATPPAAPPPRLLASILPPAAVSFDVANGFALSPDGTRLAFAALDASGQRDLWLEDLGRGEAHVLAGTRDATWPFWSTDGRQLGFYADGKVKSLDLQTSVVESLTESQFFDGGAWSPRGEIVLGSTWLSGLRVIPANGEPTSPGARDEAVGPESLVWPTLLPDGQHYLYLARRYASNRQTGEVRVASIDDPTARVLFESNSNVLYAAPGYLLWWWDGNLRAQRFDTERLELVGEPTALVADVGFDPDTGWMAVTVADNGLLVYQAGGELERHELMLVDRSGRQLVQITPPGSYYGPRLSPDGRRVVSDVSDETNRGDIWIFDLDRVTGTRVTSFAEDETRPRWSRDGTRVVYSSMAGGSVMTLWETGVTAGAEPQPLHTESDRNLRVTDWSSQGVVLLDRPNGSQYDLYAYDPARGELRPWLATRFSERAASASPDGDFAAYVSEDSGRPEVWIRTFPSGDAAWRVSSDGGDWPCWRADGGELYFVARDDSLMAVPVTWRTAPNTRSPAFGVPEPLFKLDALVHTDRQYDTLDGQRFLVNRTVHAAAGTPLTVVQGWQPARVDH